MQPSFRDRLTSSCPNNAATIGSHAAGRLSMLVVRYDHLVFQVPGFPTETESAKNASKSSTKTPVETAAAAETEIVATAETEIVAAADTQETERVVLVLVMVLASVLVDVGNPQPTATSGGIRALRRFCIGFVR
ncbi:hypothetical protein HDU81_001000, partial [Chytriomyces hyalinus]